MQKPAKPLPLCRPFCYLAGMEERIIQLESIAAMQDETMARLNDELFRQQQDISRLQRAIRILEQKIEELQEPNPIAGNERPPHY